MTQSNQSEAQRRNEEVRNNRPQPIKEPEILSDIPEPHTIRVSEWDIVPLGKMLPGQCVILPLEAKIAREKRTSFRNYVDSYMKKNKKYEFSVYVVTQGLGVWCKDKPNGAKILNPAKKKAAKKKTTKKQSDNKNDS